MIKHIAARRGANRPAVAVTLRILTIVYHLLKEKKAYHELGPNYYDERSSTQVTKQEIRKLIS
jgi:hypothetical protein